MNKEEIELLNEMKENCLNGAKYIDPKSMEKYNLLRKLEDRINELQQENKELHNKIDKCLELLGQYLPSYASCIKLLDELEEMLKESDVDES